MNGALINIKNKHGLDPLQCVEGGAFLPVFELHEFFRLYRDVYGNTIFHLLIEDDFVMGKDQLWSYICAQQFNFAEYICVQNMFGQTPLHIAASKKRDAEEALDLIFCNFDRCNLDLLIVDEKGDTFFHTYLSSIGYRADITFIKRLIEGEYKSCCKAKMKKLLRSKNRTGYTPLHIFVSKELSSYEMSPDVKVIQEMFLKAGADINSSNNLGETIAHSMVHSYWPHHEATMIAVKNGADLNLQNIFGETVIFISRRLPSLYGDRFRGSEHNANYLEFLMDSGVKLNICNKTGQTALMVNMPQLCENFDSVIQMFGKKIDVNKQDMFGNNLLHYIAWTVEFDSCENIERQDIFTWSDFSVHQDCLGQLPCDIAYARGNKRVLCDICVCKNGVHNEQLVFYSREILFESLKQKDILYRNCVQTLRKYFAECTIRNIMNVPFIGLVNFDDEANTIKTAIVRIVEDICRRIGEKDELLSNTVILSGSVAENTKVGLPDEFDFLCMLEKMSDLFHIEESFDNSYVMVKLKKEMRDNASGRFFIPYSDFSLCKKKLLDRFIDVLHEIIQMSDIFTHPNIFYVTHDFKANTPQSPNFRLTLKWSCCKYKNMTVKIDLVPACQISCPPGSKCYSKTFNSNINKNDRVLILFRNTFHYNRNEGMCRISAANAEKRLLASLSQEAKESYVVSKILCNDRICPSVKDVDKRYEGARKGEYPDCASTISGYMLKNCLFHLAKQVSEETSSRLSVHTYVCRIFQMLLKCSLEENLPCYMFPWQNLFTFPFDYDKGITPIKCVSRAVYAKFVLNIIGKNEDFADISPKSVDIYYNEPDMSTGETIAGISNFLHASDLTRDNYICANCKKNPDQHGITLEVCSRCKLWTYCSVKCQKDNWKRHKPACDYHYNNS